MHLIEHIGTYTDHDTRMRLGCTCRSLRPLIRRSKVKRFLEQRVMLKEYQALRAVADEWAEGGYRPSEEIMENIIPWRKNDAPLVSSACFVTLAAYMGVYDPDPDHRDVDPELYDLVCDELQLDCPDIVLLYTFWRKVQRAGGFKTRKNNRSS